MKKYIGDKKFYRDINKIFWPLIFGLIMTSILTIVDMIMLSQYDKSGYGVTGVSTVMKYAMTSGPVLFAILTGVGIFASQAFGAKKYDDLKKCFGLTLIGATIFAILDLTFLTFFGKNIITFFLKKDNEGFLLQYQSAIDYLKINKYSSLFFPFSYAIAAALRQIKQTKIPMWINIGTVALNTLLNYIFINGVSWAGIPSMGIEGAAYATLVARISSLAIFLIVLVKYKPPFLGKAKEMFNISWKFYKPILIVSIPIIVSETMFGIARFMYSKFMSELGNEVLAGEHIAFNITSVMNAFVMATANVCAIMIGVALGAAKKGEDIDDTANHLLGFMTIVSIGVFLITFFILPFGIKLYGSENEILISSANQILKINAIFLALRVFSSGITFMIRAGGDTWFALFIDSGMAWLIGIPLSYLALVLYIDTITPMQLRAVVLTESTSKVGLAFWRFRSKKFLKKLV